MLTGPRTYRVTGNTFPPIYASYLQSYEFGLPVEASPRFYEKKSAMIPARSSYVTSTMEVFGWAFPSEGKLEAYITDLKNMVTQVGEDPAAGPRYLQRLEVKAIFPDL